MTDKPQEPIIAQSIERRADWAQTDAPLAPYERFTPATGMDAATLASIHLAANTAGDDDVLELVYAYSQQAARIAELEAPLAQPSLPTPPAPDIDTEAIAWAYQKLLAFRVGANNMDSALMLDRLNLMLMGAN